MSSRYSEIPRESSSHNLSLCQSKVIRKMSCFDARDHANNEKPKYNHKTFCTNSLPRPGRNPSSTSIEVTRIPAEEVAAQLTLIDSELFKKLDLEEFISCGWIKKNKQQIAPNIVEYTRRFNHVSYWAVEEILIQDSSKARSEVISYFVKVSKRLFDLNNLHSLFAIVSALRNASIYRLNNTWSYMSKRDKQSIEKYVELFSDKDNWSKLREHMNMLKLPCVPYIGVYLTDLVYLSMANPSCSLAENSAANNIFRIVTTYQSESSYAHLPKDYQLQAKLRSVRFIDELLKFVEDDNYKRSLQLEPPSSEQQATAHHQSPQKFVPTHKKTNSWGNKSKLSNGEAASVESLRNLLDDSLLEKSEASSGDLSVPLTQSEDTCGITLDGCLRRKTLLKNGKKPPMSAWQRYWVKLWGPTLLYYAAKSLSGSEKRSDFKSDPCKMKSISGWLVQIADDPLHPDSFHLADPTTGTMYKFRAGSSVRSLVWCRKIQESQKIYRHKNLIRFD